MARSVLVDAGFLVALLSRRDADHRWAAAQKYADLPMSLADACLERMTEMLGNAGLLTTDTDFRIYRRHGRQTVPSILPR
jgi:predicted nucleic acid-binding protein